MKIALVAGHTAVQGKDMGAVGYVNEGIANRQQMLACSKYLEGCGVDIYVEPDGYELKEEIAWVNRIRPDLAVAFHNNAGGGKGFEAFISVTKSTEKLAKVAEEHIKAIGQNSRGIKIKRNNGGGDYFGFLRQTCCPAIIFETAFVDRREDASLIDTEDKNDNIGRVYASAIAKTYGLSGALAPVRENKAGNERKYRTLGSCPIVAGGKEDTIIGWTKRDEVLEGAVTGSYLKLDIGGYVKIDDSLIKLTRYEVLEDTYYRADTNYRSTGSIARAGEHVWGVPYSNGFVRIDRGKYLPLQLKEKWILKRV